MGDFLSKLVSGEWAECDPLYPSERGMRYRPWMFWCGVPQKAIQEGYILAHKLLFLSAFFWCMAFFAIGYTLHVIMTAGEPSDDQSDSQPQPYGCPPCNPCSNPETTRYNFPLFDPEWNLWAASTWFNFPQESWKSWLSIALIYFVGGALHVRSYAGFLSWTVLHLFLIAGYQTASASSYEAKWKWTGTCGAIAMVVSYLSVAWFPEIVRQKLGSTTLGSS